MVVTVCKYRYYCIEWNICWDNMDNCKDMVNGSKWDLLVWSKYGLNGV